MKSYEYRILLTSMLSGVFEFYDFIIFLVMAKFLTEIFLNNSSILAYILIIASGFIARFFGGIIFGILSHKFGINKTFSTTLFLMLLCSIIIIVLPSFKEIGYLSSILLFIARVIQGASLGGEVPISVLFSIDNCKKIPKYIVSACLFFGFTVGSILAYSISFLLNKHFSVNQISFFAWKIPFLIGCILTLISIILRKIVIKNNNDCIEKNQNFSLNIPSIIKGIVLVSVPTLIYNMVYFQSSIYLSENFGLNQNILRPYLILSIFLTGLFSVLFSFIFKSYYKIYIYGATTTILLSPFLIHFILSGKLYLKEFSMLLLSIPQSMMFSGIYCILYDLFKNEKPISISISINLANAIFSPSAYIFLYFFDKNFIISSISVFVFGIIILLFLYKSFKNNFLGNRINEI